MVDSGLRANVRCATNFMTPTMKTYRLVEKDRTRVEYSIPVKQGMFYVLTIEMPESELDDIHLEAFERVAKSVDDRIKILVCADRVEKDASRAMNFQRSRLRTLMSGCQWQVNRAFGTIAKRFSEGKGVRYVTAGSFAKHSE